MIYKKIFFYTLILSFICIFLTGCKEAFSFAGKVGDKVIKNAELPSGTVFMVGDSAVTVDEWNLYARPIVEETELMYGTQIWNVQLDAEGASYADRLKENIRDRIVYIKTVCQRADEAGVSLDEDETRDVEKSVRNYMDQYTEAQLKSYGINEDTVRRIYTENALATKVYEHYTLNIDTDIAEDLIRHMSLEYVFIESSYKDANGIEISYGEDEMEERIAQANDFLEAVRGAGEPVMSLNDIPDSPYVVNELIVLRSELAERFPESITRMCFDMRAGDISDLIQLEGDYYIFFCREETNRDETNEQRIEIIKQRQQALFETLYDSWKSEVEVVTNTPIWDEIKVDVKG